MKGTRLFKQIGFVIVGSLIGISHSNAQESTSEVEVIESEDTAAVAEVIEDVAAVAEVSEDATVVAEVEPIVGDPDLGKAYFEGSKRFEKGGPSCITCHNVKNDELIPGGVLAKDLTDVYDRMGEGLILWLDSPPFPAMATSYENNKLTEMERSSLTAFLKQASEVKGEQEASSPIWYFIIGGLSGLAVILLLVSLLWMKRKKQMVKKDIFARQNKTWDAKY